MMGYRAFWIHDVSHFLIFLIFRYFSFSIYTDDTPRVLTFYTAIQTILHTHYVHETTDDTLHTLVYTHYVHETLAYIESCAYRVSSVYKDTMYTILYTHYVHDTLVYIE